MTSGSSHPFPAQVALTASQFTGTFGDVKLETLDVTIKHLVFVESSQPADSVKIPWNERTLISSASRTSSRESRPRVRIENT